MRNSVQIDAAISNQPPTSHHRWRLLVGLGLLLFCCVGLTAGSAVRSECASPPPGTVFCEDFEGTNPKDHFDDYDGNPDTENQIVSDSGPANDPANRAIRFRVPAGQRGYSDLLKVLPGSYDRLYARWYVKYEVGFNFSAPNHGSGLAAGDRDLLGNSGYRPVGNDKASFSVQYQENSRKPYSYSYYRGMYQDCSDPNGSCFGDSLPCVYDSGQNYCTKAEDRPKAALPAFTAGQWYCIEQMVDMGTPTTSANSADGRLTLWVDSQNIGDFGALWIRTSSQLKLQILSLSLFHHDGNHSVVGTLIDNVAVSTQRIGCGTAAAPAPLPPTNVRAQ